MDISSSSRMVNVIHIETFSFKPPYPGALQKKVTYSRRTITMSSIQTRSIHKVWYNLASESYVLNVGRRVWQLCLVVGLFDWLNVSRPRLLRLSFSCEDSFHVACDQFSGGGRCPREEAKVVDRHPNPQPSGGRRYTGNGDQRRRHQQELRLC